MACVQRMAWSGLVCLSRCGVARLHRSEPFLHLLCRQQRSKRRIAEHQVSHRQQRTRSSSVPARAATVGAVPRARPGVVVGQARVTASAGRRRRGQCDTRPLHGRWRARAHGAWQGQTPSRLGVAPKLPHSCRASGLTLALMLLRVLVRAPVLVLVLALALESAQRGWVTGLARMQAMLNRLMWTPALAWEPLHSHDRCPPCWPLNPPSLLSWLLHVCSPSALVAGRHRYPLGRYSAGPTHVCHLVHRYSQPGR
jgi:hypothetical protein